MNLTQAQEKILRASGVRQSAQEQLTRAVAANAAAASRAKAIEEAQALLQTVAKETQEQLVFHISDVVQAALESCFPSQYVFRFTFELKRGRTEAEIGLEKNGIAVNPMDATGGGVVDLMSFALRIACWGISKTRNTIVLDEPFKFLSVSPVNLRERAGEMLKTLSEKMGLQVIMVTHDHEMIATADRIFRVTQSAGISEVRKEG